MTINRRKSLKFLTMASLFLPTWFIPKLSIAQSATTSIRLKPTPQDVEGPYYPKAWSGDVDNDLTTFNGKKYTRGVPMLLRGLVRGQNGEILKNARVEIWQIDDAGEYRHPDFGGEGPANRGFQGYGRMQTNEDGRYEFKTIKPIGYSGRPAHVHFKVVANGYRDLVTEMYFVGENKEGSLWQSLFGGFSKERDRLSISPTIRQIGAVETLDAVFDLVLESMAT
jgi:protocatechuate 3,4-dioxygenase, beta subunit